MKTALIATLTALLVLASCAKVPQRTPQYAPAQRAPITNGNAAYALPSTITADSASPTPVAVKKVVKVGLLLPLTGRNAELGRAMQDAATVSLFDKYARLSTKQQEIRVELISKDTGDSPDTARSAAKEAIAEGVSIIIGPVFADATEAIAPIAAAKQVPVLSFSNSRLRDGTGSYMLGFSPYEQARRVIAYAVSTNKQRIGLLLPRTPLGDAVRAAAKQVANDTGKLVLVEASYAAQAVGVEEAITKLLPAGKAPAFDALMLAETGQPLESILRSLSAHGVTPSNLQFMGTGVWDDANLLARTNLDKAWLASSPPATTEQFDARFRSTYNYSPPRISSLAYDAVALAVTLATSGRAFTPENMTGTGGFVGPANGIFRLRADGSVERGLAVLKVEGGKLKVISPAPTAF
jgi:branched-chain amino acid transport system substrate-binding protein